MAKNIRNVESAARTATRGRSLRAAGCAIPVRRGTRSPPGGRAWASGRPLSQVRARLPGICRGPSGVRVLGGLAPQARRSGRRGRRLRFVPGACLRRRFGGRGPRRPRSLSGKTGPYCGRATDLGGSCTSLSTVRLSARSHQAPRGTEALTVRKRHGGQPWSMRWRGRLTGIILVLLLGAPAAAAAEGDAAPAAPRPANVTLIGLNSAGGGVREVVAELLSREGFSVSWSERDSSRPQDFLDRNGEKALAAMDVWIDLSSPSEAHLYFRDAQANRFFIRSLPLGQGIDELAKEEIGHVVASAVWSLSQEDGQALTRSQARAALQVQPAQGSGSPVPRWAASPPMPISTGCTSKCN